MLSKEVTNPFRGVQRVTYNSKHEGKNEIDYFIQ